MVQLGFFANDDLANFSASAFSGFQGFGKDTVKPTVSANHSPAEPNNTQQVTITGTAKDTLSGLDWIEIWYRKNNGSWTQLDSKCDFNGQTSSQTCQKSLSAQPAGTKIDYFARARDLAGNQNDSAVGTFTVVELKKPSPCPPYGDVNYDGFLTVDDSYLIEKFTVGETTFTPDQIERADVNDQPSETSVDADVTTADALMVAQYITGAISTFPVCSTPHQY